MNRSKHTFCLCPWQATLSESILGRFGATVQVSQLLQDIVCCTSRSSCVCCRCWVNKKITASEDGCTSACGAEVSLGLALSRATQGGRLRRCRVSTQQNAAQFYFQRLCVSVMSVYLRNHVVPGLPNLSVSLSTRPIIHQSIFSKTLTRCSRIQIRIQSMGDILYLIVSSTRALQTSREKSSGSS